MGDTWMHTDSTKLPAQRPSRKEYKNPTARTGEVGISERANQGKRTLDPKGYPLEVQKRESLGFIQTPSMREF